jgi:hypothetical protein
LLAVAHRGVEYDQSFFRHCRSPVLAAANVRRPL